MIKISVTKLLAFFIFYAGDIKVAFSAEHGGPYTPGLGISCESGLVGLVAARTTSHFTLLDGQQQLFGGVNVMRRSGMPPAKTMLFTFGGGPGLSGRTIYEILGPNSEALAKFDVGEIFPPGTITPNPPIVVPALNEISKKNLYMRHIWLFWHLIKGSLRSAAQSVVLVGHSYGGLQVADVLIYNASLPAEDRLNITDAVFVAAPLSQHTFEHVLPEQRQKYQTREWESAYLSYFNDPTQEKYKKLVVSYGETIVAREKQKWLQQRIFNSLVSPYSTPYLRKDWEPEEGLLTRLSKLDGVHKIGFAGEYDVLLPREVLERDYQRGGIPTVIIKGGSHFPFTDDMTAFISLYNEIHTRTSLGLP